MSATSNEFFLSGLAHYGTAVETVESFKEVAHSELVRLIDRRSWKKAKLDSNWREEVSKYQKQTQIYVSISVACRIEGETCDLEFGLWWNREEPGVELYAGLHGEKEQKWRKNVIPRTAGTKRYIGQTSYLLRSCTNADWQNVANGLLDEIEEAAIHARQAKASTKA